MTLSQYKNRIRKCWYCLPRQRFAAPFEGLLALQIPCYLSFQS